MVDRVLIPRSFLKPTVTSTRRGIDFEYTLHDTIPFSAFAWESVSLSTLDSDETTMRIDMEAIESRHPGSFHRWELCGVTAETLLSRRRIRISHWWIISPLTLLSAFLLLSKPRQAKEPEPAPIGGE